MLFWALLVWRLLRTLDFCHLLAGLFARLPVCCLCNILYICKWRLLLTVVLFSIYAACSPSVATLTLQNSAVAMHVLRSMQDGQVCDWSARPLCAASVFCKLISTHIVKTTWCVLLFLFNQLELSRFSSMFRCCQLIPKLFRPHHVTKFMVRKKNLWIIIECKNNVVDLYVAVQGLSDWSVCTNSPTHSTLT